MAGMVSIREVLPDEHNIITLDPELKDHDGIPAPGIDYRLSENSRNMLNFSITRAMEVLEAAGAIKLRSTSPIANGRWHLMGTARMDTDPAKSVVNEWGRSHDVKNLFIIDGSIFVKTLASIQHAKYRRWRYM